MNYSLTGESASISNQRDILVNYCQSQGWQVVDVFQDGLQCNSSLLVFEELRQKSCGEGRAHIRNHLSDDSFQQVHVTDLVPLHNVFELDRVEQVMKVELGRSILVADVGKVRHTTGY